MPGPTGATGPAGPEGPAFDGTHVLEGDSQAPPAELELGQLLYDGTLDAIDPAFFWWGTQAEYDAIPNKSDNILYVIVT